MPNSISEMTTNKSGLRAYISGALTGVNSDELRNLYETAAAALVKHGWVPYLPHTATDPIRHSEIPAPTVYRVDREEIAKADLVVVFLFPPSFGVGIELELAASALRPVLLLAPRGVPISRMVSGNPARKYGPLRFESAVDLERQLDIALPVIVDELSQRVQGQTPEIGRGIREGRERAGLSQVELARRVGIEEAYVSMLEDAPSSVSNPSLATLAAIARVVDSPLESLIGVSTQSVGPMRRSLQDYAVRVGLTYRGYSRLVSSASRTLPANAELSDTEWRDLQEELMRALDGIEQPQLLPEK